MTKIICLFNHKGGVSKTTTTFNLGWKLAEKGKKVILADFDPQCNLTGMVLGFRDNGAFDDLYESEGITNIKSGLLPAFESKPKPIEAVNCILIPQQRDLLTPSDNNLFLLPGHIGLSEYENTLGIAQELSGSLHALKNLPGAIRYLLDITGKEHNADFILVDMSPSLGPINQNLLSVCDYFIVPLHPDYFSSMALNSLSNTLPKWKRWAEQAYQKQVLREADYPFPEPRSQFIGAVVQKYRPRNGKASRAFQHWIDNLESALQKKLIPTLTESEMLESRNFEAKLGTPPDKPILEVADFNSLIALSQENQVPVYSLTREQALQSGSVWEQTQKSMKHFGDAFESCADKVIKLSS